MNKPSVLIIGGGVFGTSTAYHLSIRGYHSVKVLDRFDAPSKDSAATDLNKVIRVDYPEPLYTKLGLEALDAWKDPSSVLTGLYHESGVMFSGEESTHAWLEATRKTMLEAGRKGVKYMTSQEIGQNWPAVTGKFPSWLNLWSPAGGWVPSGEALLRMANAARTNGVEYVSGDAGYTRRLVYDGNKKCIGAICNDGSFHQADIVVIAAGANTATLVDARNEVEAQCSAICVLQLKPEEIEKYKDMPVISNLEQGIIFPPVQDGLIKLISCRAITNYKNKILPGASVLHSTGDYPFDGCPREIEHEVRSFVRDTVPELANRPFISTKLCWDGVAKDLNFRVCPYPDTTGLYIGTIGSNHGFKFLPVIGRYVADMLEGNLGKEWSDLWAWKDGRVPGGKPNPYPFPLRDLSELEGWKDKHSAGEGRLPWTWSRL
ncbi:unnamed protein product [Clonostachys solani]|uniref:FAD dependent oxidoreductase domain-containing protein n=1 Tax=Clonostachys solani TaxID=160281 RepID=A0A9N9Z081_9HYPO|nr:unnamed protein product [Clonostachys solani]